MRWALSKSAFPQNTILEIEWLSSVPLWVCLSWWIWSNISVPENWVVALPDNISSKTLMSYGTAGMTAILAVSEILSGWTVQDRCALVTGATGGVGSFAVAMLKSAALK